ncbi:ead/Ea22-like family protein [Salmonella enterica subsp. enterica serovar Brandenburg]
MSNIDKQVLREAADKATKGQWAVEFDDEIYSTDGVNHEQIAMVFSENEASDAAFIAAANPATVLALLDELEAAKQERENWRVSFDNERFRADKLAAALNAEHEQHVMASSALITQHVRANRAESRIAELESNPIATLDVQSGRADGNKFALVYSSAAHKLPDDVYHLCVAAAGIGKGE